MIPWDKEKLNSISENISRGKDMTLLYVRPSGLYRVEVGVFGSGYEGDYHLVVNEN